MPSDFIPDDIEDEGALQGSMVDFGTIGMVTVLGVFCRFARISPLLAAKRGAWLLPRANITTQQRLLTS